MRACTAGQTTGARVGLSQTSLSTHTPVAPLNPLTSTIATFGVTASRSWETTSMELLDESVACVEEEIARRAASGEPINAVGGICDGSVLASRVAALHPELLFYLNFCAGPPSTRLPCRVPLHVTVPSLHLLGRIDEFFSGAELLEIVSWCDRSAVVWHPRGHVVPPLTVKVLATLNDMIQRCSSRSDAAPLDVSMASSVVHETHVELQAPVGTEAAHAADDGFDSMALLHVGGRSHSAQFNVLFNMYGIAMLMVVHSHWGNDVLTAAELAGGGARLSSYLRLVERFAPFATFAIMAGVTDHQHGVGSAQLRRELCTNAVMLYAMYYSHVPDWVNATYQATHHLHGGVCVSKGCSIVGRLTAPVWWFLAISSFRTLHYVATINWSSNVRRKALPVLALLAHFGSFGMLLPYPLRRGPLHRLYGQSALPLATFLPIRQPPFALASMWWLYATVPLFLPQGFPLNLPLADSICGCWSWLVVRMRTPPTTLSPTTAVRLFWIVLALVGTRISDIYGLDRYATLPYACADLPQPCSDFQCIGAVQARGGEAWSLLAVLANILSCVMTVVKTAGFAAAAPRVPLPMLAIMGQHSLLVLVAHTFAAPFLMTAAGKGLQYSLWAVGAGEYNFPMLVMLALLATSATVCWLLLAGGAQAVTLGSHVIAKFRTTIEQLALRSASRGTVRPVTIDGEVASVKSSGLRLRGARLLLLLLAVATVLNFRLRRTEVCMPRGNVKLIWYTRFSPSDRICKGAKVQTGLLISDLHLFKLDSIRRQATEHNSTGRSRVRTQSAQIRKARSREEMQTAERQGQSRDPVSGMVLSETSRVLVLFGQHGQQWTHIAHEINAWRTLQGVVNSVRPDTIQNWVLNRSMQWIGNFPCPHKSSQVRIPTVRVAVATEPFSVTEVEQICALLGRCGLRFGGITSGINKWRSLQGFTSIRHSIDVESWIRNHSNLIRFIKKKEVQTRAPSPAKATLYNSTSHTRTHVPSGRHSSTRRSQVQSAQVKKEMTQEKVRAGWVGKAEQKNKRKPVRAGARQQATGDRQQLAAAGSRPHASVKSTQQARGSRQQATRSKQQQAAESRQDTAVNSWQKAAAGSRQRQLMQPDNDGGAARSRRLLFRLPQE